ncbi:MAG TPA: META domain-containing protein [Cellvibrionaceae bacterium]
MVRMLTVLCAGLSLVACQMASPPDEYTFDCAGELIRAEFAGEQLNLYRGDSHYRLQATATASGAQYVTPEGHVPGLVFWNKGDEAILKQGDQAHVSCQRHRPPTVPFSARGQEPGWILEVNESQLNLRYQYNEKQFQAPAPKVERVNNGYRYRAQNLKGQKLQLLITQGICIDTMSDMHYPYAAQLQIDGQTLNGCAGDPRQLLVGKEWIVEDISGQGIVDSSRVTVEFSDDGKIFGHAGCNRYTGSYQLSGEGLAVGSLVSTQMACADALMNQENEMLKVLQGIARFEVDKTGALWLRGKGEWLKAYD